MTTLGYLLRLRARVTRGPYLRWGLGLALLKFVLDTAVVWACTRRAWSPLGYLVPSFVLRDHAVGPAPEVMYLLLAALALPFLWIGVSMSVRRAADAGISPAWIRTPSKFSVDATSVVRMRIARQARQPVTSARACNAFGGEIALRAPPVSLECALPRAPRRAPVPAGRTASTEGVCSHARCRATAPAPSRAPRIRVD
jgi:hypothetical protein